MLRHIWGSDEMCRLTSAHSNRSNFKDRNLALGFGCAPRYLNIETQNTHGYVVGKHRRFQSLVRLIGAACIRIGTSQRL